jgi:hypothetical protein
VVAARFKTRNRPETISPDAVGHQPLARFRLGKIAAYFAAEIDHGGNGGIIAIGSVVHTGIMNPWRPFELEENK